MTDATNILQEIAKYIGLTGGALTIFLSSGAIAYGFFRFLGSKWIESKFSVRLEAFKHEQQKELADLKAKIDVQFDRVKKFNEREYEILPKAWELLVIAEGDINEAIKEYENYTSGKSTYEITPHDERLNNDLSEFGFSEDDKLEFRKSNYENSKFIEIFTRNLAANAHVSVIDLNNYLLKNSIFINREIRDLLKEISDTMDKVIMRWRFDKLQNKNFNDQNFGKNSISEIKRIKDKIEILIDQKLTEAK